MKNFFEPESILIFGVSKNEKKSGNHVLKNILNYSRESVYLIHPKHEEIYGIKCYKGVDELPTNTIDLVIIILPVNYVLDTLLECLDIDINTIIIESGSLYVKGEEERETQKKLKQVQERLKNRSTRILGPNSIGFYCANRDKNDLTTSLIYFDKLPGLKKKNLSIISQTGLTLSGILQGQNYIQELGIAKIAAIGNKFDVNESDVLELLEHDTDTDAIALYLEDIKEGGRFRDLCARIAPRKPIILLKSGKTKKGKDAIVSHTKSLAGNYKIIEGLSRQTGLIMVDDFKEMLDVAKVLLSQPTPQGNRIGVISISGAGTVLSCDLAEKYELKLPALSQEQYESLREIFPKFAWEDVYNPLDIWSSVEYVGPEKAYLSAGEIFLKHEDRFDMLIYLLTGIKETEFDWKKLHELNERYDIPIYIGLFSGDKKLILKWREKLEERYNIPIFQSITTLMETISKVIKRTTKNKND